MRTSQEDLYAEEQNVDLHDEPGLTKKDFEQMNKQVQVMTKLEEALILCKSAHAGQFRKDGATPYETHPIRVAELLNTDKEKIVALLHDVIEETSTTIEEIKSKFEPSIYEAIFYLTHKKSQTYAEYITEIVGCNLLTRRVKIADIVANLCDEPSEYAKKKYFKALKELL